MNRITRFKEKSITIDGLIGTIMQLEKNGRCEFIYRNQNAINSSTINKHMLSYNGKEYKIKPTHEYIFNRYKQTHYEAIVSWGAYYPNGEYIRRDFALQKAEKKSQ